MYVYNLQFYHASERLAPLTESLTGGDICNLETRMM